MKFVFKIYVQFFSHEIRFSYKSVKKKTKNFVFKFDLCSFPFSFKYLIKYGRNSELI